MEQIKLNTGWWARLRWWWWLLWHKPSNVIDDPFIDQNEKATK